MKKKMNKLLKTGFISFQIVIVFAILITTGLMSIKQFNGTSSNVSNEVSSSIDKSLSIVNDLGSANGGGTIPTPTPPPNPGEDKCALPKGTEITQGTKYEDDTYTYVYMQEFDENSWKWINMPDVGWGIKLKNGNSTASVAETPCTSVNNIPVVSMRSMFYYAKASSIDVSTFDTSKVIDMANMFASSEATLIKGLDRIDVSNVISMQSMFSNSKAEIIDLSNMKTSSLKNMSFIFFNSAALTIDLSNMDTSKVETMSAAFENSNAASVQGLATLSTTSLTDISQLFRYSKVSTIDLSSFNLDKVINTSYAFTDTTATTGYARNQVDANKLNASSNKPSALTFKYTIKYSITFNGITTDYTAYNGDTMGMYEDCTFPGGHIGVNACYKPNGKDYPFELLDSSGMAVYSYTVIKPNEQYIYQRARPGAGGGN